MSCLTNRAASGMPSASSFLRNAVFSSAVSLKFTTVVFERACDMYSRSLFAKMTLVLVDNVTLVLPPPSYNKYDFYYDKKLTQMFRLCIKNRWGIFDADVVLTAEVMAWLLYEGQGILKTCGYKQCPDAKVIGAHLCSAGAPSRRIEVARLKSAYLFAHILRDIEKHKAMSHLKFKALFPQLQKRKKFRATCKNGSVRHTDQIKGW